MKMIFLVDGDNNIGTGLQGVEYLTPEDSILIFYQKTGLALSKIQELCKNSKANIQYLESVKGGKNSIDFQIITELGVLIGRGEADYAYVISQDKGYEAAMSALQARYADTFREVALRPSIAACLRAFLLRATDLQELQAALVREYGPLQGRRAFEHLTELFQTAAKQQAASSAVRTPPAAQTETVPVKRTRSRRRKSSQENAKTAPQPKTAEQPDVPAAAAKQSPAAPLTGEPAAAEKEQGKPVKTNRSRRGGRGQKRKAPVEN